MWSLATYTDVKPIIAIDVTEIRGFSKRIVDNIDLSESREYIYRLKKA